jgi:hypothetical protein
MSAPPTVAKTIWTDADFDAMDWHDNAVHAIGFAQYLRRAPLHSPGQWLSAEERGGFSFDQRGYTPDRGFRSSVRW